MERAIVMMDPVAMSVIGVDAGDQVVVEGVPGRWGEPVPELRLRVVAATDSAIEERRGLTGGGVESRFPSALDALGVWPDLGWAFLDFDARQALNLGASRVAAVRIRASRRDLLFKEIRELMLLAAIAAIGLLTLTDSAIWRMVALAGLLLVGAGIVVNRLRIRVSKRTPHRRRRARELPDSPA